MTKANTNVQQNIHMYDNINGYWIVLLTVWISTSSIRSRNRESLVEDWTSGNNRSRRFRKSNGHCRKASCYFIEGFPRGIINWVLASFLVVVYEIWSKIGS